MHQMTLKNIEKACSGQLYPGGKGEAAYEGEIELAVLDSRQVRAGALFLATVGERVDGHGFIASVYEQGAVCVITQKTPAEVEREHGISPEAWGAYILVQDTLKALKDIAEFYRQTLSIPVIGITGSVGKTSTKEFIAGVLGEKYRVLKTEGNFNNEIGLPLTLLRIREEHEAAVVEMGISDFGEMHRLSKMARPDICVITNIGDCHLENLGSREGVLQAKSEIFDYLPDTGAVCLNIEDPLLAAVQQVKGREPYFFGLGEQSKAAVYADEIVSRGLLGSTARLHLKSGSIGVEIPLPGRHMVLNAAAAACVGELLQLQGSEIAAGIAGVMPVDGRSKLIHLPDYTLIDDCYNANPVSMKAAIDLLAQADTVKAAILGDMFELGIDSEAMHGEIGAYAAAAGLDILICVGSKSRSMFDEAVRARGIQRVFHYETQEELLEALAAGKDLIRKGSTVLIKASHGMGFSRIVDYFVQ